MMVAHILLIVQREDVFLLVFLSEQFSGFTRRGEEVAIVENV
jgi:hypothetical protein